MDKEFIVLADGEQPTHAIPLGFLKSKSPLVCCDGAAEVIIEKDIIPDCIIGDMDSFPKGSQKQWKDKLLKISDQETNDLTKAVNWCIDQGAEHIIILGATGKREDHSLSNIFLMLDYAKRLDVHMYTNYGYFTVVSGDVELDSFLGQQVSIFSPSREYISTQGLAYSTDKRLDSLWMGSLNESQGETFKITADEPILVFRTYDKT